MTGDPLMPHLMDILEHPELAGVVLGGGFGIRLKRQHLANEGTETLISRIPPARATADFDIFLRIDVLANAEQCRRMGSILQEELGYKIRLYNWQFEKSIGEQFPDRRVKIDLLTRAPLKGENVKVRKMREKSLPDPKPSKVGEGALHGFLTEEAFAIERDPVLVPVRGVTTKGKALNCQVTLPHPYAFLNMKVRAAHDWLRMDRGEIERKRFAEKHPFDVYVLAAMLTESELDRCEELAAEFAHHEVAQEIRAQAEELFKDPTSPGWIEVRRQLGEEINFEAFDDGLRRALGYAR